MEPSEIRGRPHGVLSRSRITLRSIRATLAFMQAVRRRCERSRRDNAATGFDHRRRRRHRPRIRARVCRDRRERVRLRHRYRGARCDCEGNPRRDRAALRHGAPRRHRAHGAGCGRSSRRARRADQQCRHFGDDAAGRRLSAGRLGQGGRGQSHRHVRRHQACDPASQAIQGRRHHQHVVGRRALRLSQSQPLRRHQMGA